MKSNDRDSQPPDIERLSEEIEELRHDISRHIGIVSGQQQEIEQLRAVVKSIIGWNNRNGGYGELPPLMRDAEAVLSCREREEP